jgi:hypothetical protein
VSLSYIDVDELRRKIARQVLYDMLPSMIGISTEEYENFKKNPYVPQPPPIPEPNYELYETISVEIYIP